MTKNPKFSKFQSFYAIFVKFSTEFVDWNVENAQRDRNGRNSLSSMLFRRDNGCFLNEKYIKFKPKMTKNPKFSKFQSFYAIFVKFSTEFVDWNVENAQRDRNGRNSLSSMLFRRDNGCFLNEKYIKFKPKMTKNPKFSKFQSFYAIFVKFSIDFLD